MVQSFVIKFNYGVVANSRNNSNNFVLMHMYDQRNMQNREKRLKRNVLKKERNKYMYLYTYVYTIYKHTCRKLCEWQQPTKQ